MYIIYTLCFTFTVCAICVYIYIYIHMLDCVYIYIYTHMWIEIHTLTDWLRLHLDVYLQAVLPYQVLPEAATYWGPIPHGLRFQPTSWFPSNDICLSWYVYGIHIYGFIYIYTHTYVCTEYMYVYVTYIYACVKVIYLYIYIYTYVYYINQPN